jgi:hypothetical protein
MKFQPVKFKLAGLSLEGAKDEQGEYYVSISALEENLGFSVGLTHKVADYSGYKMVLAPNSLGKECFMLHSVEASVIVTAAAISGNQLASALVASTLAEVIERRIDYHS